MGGARATPGALGPDAGLAHALAEEMAAWEADGLRRHLVDPPAGARRVDFVSNDYLGLSAHPALLEAAREALAAGAGGRASRLLGGGSPHHAAAERAVAEWLGAEAGLLFPSGYQANLGLVGALVGRGDALFSDELNHASLVDAARLSRATVHVHRHLDLAQLEQQLERAHGARRRLVLTEGVFSMRGDAPDLDALAELCARHRAWLVVDEAHSAGVVGPAGRGAWAAARGTDAGPLAARVVTGGKALGVAGAVVVGSAALREHLINRARSFAFTTAPPPATAAALAAAVACAADADAARERLHGLHALVARALGREPLTGAILPVSTGSPASALALSEEAARHGLDVRAVRPPTVPREDAGLRVVLHAFNTEAECDDLTRVLREAPRPPAAPLRVREADRALFVVGTDTEVGKTVVSALLLRAAKTRGPSAYWKPVQTGTDSDTDAVERMAGARPHELLRPAWSLPLPASPHEAAADAGHAIHMARLAEGLAGLRRTMPDTHLLVELAGGLLVPYRTEPEVELQADWLARERARLVLVARSGLGTLNHTLLSLEALRRRHLEPSALFLVGPPHPSNRATLAALGGVPHVFELEHLEDLALDPVGALDRWLARHDLGALFPEAP